MSWSDMAVPLPTVKDADALVAALRARKVPYIIKGLARLFDAPEIQALVSMFRYMTGTVSESEVADFWRVADLLPEGKTVAPALRLLDEGANFRRGDRWGTYNIQRLYLDVLEALDVREATIPGGASRAELVMYQLGKFSQ